MHWYAGSSLPPVLIHFRAVHSGTVSETAADEYRASVLLEQAVFLFYFIFHRLQQARISF